MPWDEWEQLAQAHFVALWIPVVLVILRLTSEALV